MKLHGTGVRGGFLIEADPVPVTKRGRSWSRQRARGGVQIKDEMPFGWIRAEIKILVASGATRDGAERSGSASARAEAGVVVVASCVARHGMRRKYVMATAKWQRHYR